MSGAGAPRFTTREVTLEMKPRILVILGSTREGRVGERVAHWLLRQLDGQQAAAFELVDLRDYPLPIYEGPSGERRGATVQRWADKVAAVDGYVVVTPEYNHGYPAALKSALDHAYDEWNRKPVAFVSYGGHAAGYRAVEQLRLVAVELQMVPIREQVAIQAPWAAFDEQGGLMRKGAEEAVRRMVDDARLTRWQTARIIPPAHRKPRRGVGEPIRASRRWHWSGQPPIRTWLPLGPASP
jgi:NAD(P)H-dependent FMN reductase